MCDNLLHLNQMLQLHFCMQELHVALNALNSEIYRFYKKNISLIKIVAEHYHKLTALVFQFGKKLKLVGDDI